MKKQILIAFLCATSLSQISFISEIYAAQPPAAQAPQELYNALSTAQQQRINAVAELFFYRQPTNTTPFSQSAIELKIYAAANPLDGTTLALEAKLQDPAFMNRIKDSNSSRNVAPSDVLNKRNEYLASRPVAPAPAPAPIVDNPEDNFRLLSELDDSSFNAPTKRNKATRQAEWDALGALPMAQGERTEARRESARMQGKPAKRAAQNEYNQDRNQRLNAREMAIYEMRVEAAKERIRQYPSRANNNIANGNDSNLILQKAYELGFQG